MPIGWPVSGCSTSISYGVSWAPTPPTAMSPPQSTTKRRVAREADRDRVGAQALAGATGVDHHSRRTGDRSGLIVDDDLAPRGRAGSGRAGTSRRRVREGLLERGRFDAVERVVVAGLLERSHERRVDQPAAALRRPQPGAHGRTQQRRSRNARARIVVERRQVAVRAKPRQPIAEVEHEGPLAVGRLQR